MNTIPEFDFNYEYFLDKSVMLFGATRTGKSFIVTDILYHLRPHVDQIIVISPMDRQNHTYDRGLVPVPCIHYTITSELLNDIWQRQNALVAVYTRANRPEILCKLFERIPDNHTARDIISNINDKLKNHRRELEETYDNEYIVKEKTKAMENECQKLIMLIFKHYIEKSRSILQKMNLTPEEHFSLKYLNLNPRLVFVFDDCTDLLKKFKTHSVIQRLFYQGRWNFITFLIACHTDKALDPELKKSSFISIFTDEASARAYFGRPSNDLDKEAKAKAAVACRSTFVSAQPFQKLAWIREENKFYRLTSTSHKDFKFGSPYIWEYCKKIQADGNFVHSDNKFISDFS